MKKKPKSRNPMATVIRQPDSPFRPKKVEKKSELHRKRKHKGKFGNDE